MKMYIGNKDMMIFSETYLNPLKESFISMNRVNERLLAIN